MSTLLTERSRRATAGGLAGLVCMLAGGCGSQLDPYQVAAAREGGAAQVAGAAAAPPAGGEVAAQPGDAPGAGAGTPPAADAPQDATGLGAPADPGAPDAPAASGGGDVPADVPEANAPVGDGPQGTCEGFANGPGITDSTITIANASDITGPVPGLFLAARQGTEAFAAYYNATEKLCGRSLKVLELDSSADAGADQQAYTRACNEAFAAVGSVSSADAGGAATAAGCGLPDVRAFTVTPQRQGCGTCFASYSVDSSQIAASQPQYWLKKEPQASQHVGIFYVDVAAAKTNAESFGRGFEKAGMNVDVVQGIQTSEFNYVPYVETMKREDLDFIMYFGPYQFAIRLQKAMQQQGFRPTVYLQDPTIYDAGYVAQAGGAGEGSYVYSTNELFDSQAAEMKLYRAYLDQVAPGATPNYYGLYAWSATRLFVEQATALGGRLDRASLVAALRKVKGWTGNGLHAPMSVGTGDTSPCIRIIRLTGSTWKQVSPGDYVCGGLIGT
ncbi:ABC transporter substrate-binding protein [Nocardioides rubriscoriae]|uniref:ABC transporter substrate-binding protein n=1 Tax=Nocardioides rubriscoriae TaxID=642762 RepID=UPI0011DF0F86|nr:ABC transporter substrate-binding protein [Nocardioides rubriscoriae]